MRIALTPCESNAKPSLWLASRTARFACTAVLLAFSGQAFAESAESIANRALENNVFSTSNARAEVDLSVEKRGKITRRRQIATKIKRKDGTVRSFVEFLSPADVAGTKFLSIENKGDEATQYIYLPAFKKVKRVVGSQRSKSFMGTDFSYADLDGRDVDESTWKTLSEEKIGGQDCHVVEGIPKKPDEDSYGKTILWVHKKHLIPMRIDFYTRDQKKVKKRLSVKKLEKKSGRWVATDSVMATMKKKTKTRLKVVKIDFDTNIPDEDLTKQALER